MAKQYWNQEVSDAFQQAYVDPNAGFIAPFGSARLALRFGWERALKDEYPNESWEEVEEDLERAWHEKHRQEGTWQEMKQHVRHAWEQARVDWKGLASKVRSEL